MQCFFDITAKYSQLIVSVINLVRIMTEFNLSVIPNKNYYSLSSAYAGEYLITVKFNDQPIPDSPFKVYILPATGDSKKLKVNNLQQLGLQVKHGVQSLK